MAIIRTVVKDIGIGKLGITYMHEHLIVKRAKYNNLPFRILLDDYDKTKKEIMQFKNYGGCTIVDVQPFGAGRDIEWLHKLSKETGINIIASTGVHKKVFYKEDFWVFNADFNDIVELFISEIEDGAFAFDIESPFKRKTKIRTGIIKIATDEYGITEYYKRIFKAAAYTHKKTCVPIITHTEYSSFGLEQAQFLMEHGVNPEKIIISHMDKKINLKNIINLARMGVFLEFDCIARFKYHSDEEEVELIKKMIENGYENQLLLGMDSTRGRFLSYGGNYGLKYILDNFIKLMKKMGIEDKSIKKMLVDNPAVALSFD